MRFQSCCLSVLATILPFWVTPAMAAAFRGPAEGVVERVIDGDTVKMWVAVWIDQELLVSVRVAGIDAPELFRAKCPAEKRRARAAKAFVETFMQTGHVRLIDLKRGKYAGRVVARIEVDGRDLGAALIEAGHAYDGPRGTWCP